MEFWLRGSVAAREKGEFMKIFVISIFLMISTGCAQAEQVEGVMAPNDVMPYVLQFQWQGLLHGRDISLDGLDIKLSNTLDRPQNVGECHMQSKRVILRLDYWLYANEYLRELLVFHELGHCLLNRKHNNELDAAIGMPSSVMNFSLFNEYYYYANREQYLVELFGTNFKMVYLPEE